MTTETKFESFLAHVQKVLAQYLSDSEQGKGAVLTQHPPHQIAQALNLTQWIEDGGITPDGAADFLKEYLSHTQHMHHPGYIGHQVAIPHIGSVMADLIHGAINNPMAIFEMGPAGATMEQTLINWMLAKIGWGNLKDITNYQFETHSAGGVFTHGGSLANLTALLAARSKIAPDAWEKGVPDDLVIVCSEVAHYAIARSVAIMGMGSQSIVSVPVNDLEVMRMDALGQVIAEQKAKGKRILAVVGNACATSTGLYDPLDKIGLICQKEKIWFHIDGAHGASVLLSDTYTHLMDGIQYADSLVWDAHKMLRTSSLCAAVFFKDRKIMEQMFRQKGSYLFHDKEEPGFDLMPYTIECTKSGLATKLFWVLAIEGEKGLGNFVTQLYDQTKSFHDFISKEIDFECPYFPESNILCFRYTQGEDQLYIRKALLSKGDFYISSAEVNGVRYLRLTVMNPLTTIDHIKKLLEEIRQI